MNVERQLAKTIPLYPLLISLYPPLMLLAANLGQVPLAETWRVMAGSLLFGLLVYGGLRLLLGNWSRAAILSAFLLVLFFSYGHVYKLVEYREVMGIVLGRHRTVAAVWLAITVLGGWLLLRRRQYPASIHQILNAVAGVLVLLAASQVVYPLARSEVRIRQLADNAEARLIDYTDVSGNLPDVYWIILDGYGRADALLEDYHFDNSEFLDALKGLGFVIPECSMSNYPMTAFSLTATLQMNYQENFTPYNWQEDERKDYLTHHYLLEHNPVRARLDALDYEIIAFQTEYWFANVLDADTYLARPPEPASKLTKYEQMYVCTTGLCPIFEAYLTYIRRNYGVPVDRYKYRYDEIQFTLEELKKIPARDGRKFVMAHVLGPHDPFVMNAEGEYVEYGARREGYPQEVQYLNRRVLDIIQTILEQSETPPVIVVQGDHGWEMHNRTKILNAYYLPGVADQVYAEITPVNTFRIILNQYFGGTFELLPDKSYGVGPRGLADFTLVEPSCASTP